MNYVNSTHNFYSLLSLCLHPGWGPTVPRGAIVADRGMDGVDVGAVFVLSRPFGIVLDMTGGLVPGSTLHVPRCFGSARPGGRPRWRLSFNCGILPTLVSTWCSNP